MVVVSAVQPYQGAIPIIRSAADVRWDGSYNFHYESADGSLRVEEGNIVNKGSSNEYVAVKGSYRYLSPDGRTIEVVYTADENGFVPRGTVIH